MDYDETIRLLNSVVGKYVIVYPAEVPPSGEEPYDFTSGLSAWGTLKQDQGASEGAAGRRRLAEAGVYAKIRPEMDLGNAPLELYERQAAGFTFEGMDTQGAFAGFVLWRHEFEESRWLESPVRPDWLWIRKRPFGLVIAAEFPDAPKP
jgi:hypothetical protein